MVYFQKKINSFSINVNNTIKDIIKDQIIFFLSMLFNLTFEDVEKENMQDIILNKLQDIQSMSLIQDLTNLFKSFYQLKKYDIYYKKLQLLYNEKIILIDRTKIIII